MLHPAALLTIEQAKAADRATIAAGIAGEKLMENAGRAVVDTVIQKYSPFPTLVICGLGNNGGDGFVVARLLKEEGWPVTLALLGEVSELKGDAKIAKDKWNMSGGATRSFSVGLLKDSALIIDAMFGIGLDRPLEGAVRDIIAAINERRLPVVAIDIVSGINADTGAIMGAALHAEHTITFVRPKPGHVLLPGKAHTGELHVYDIGISGEGITPISFLNIPPLWKHLFPFPAPDAHKYTRGHALIVGGDLPSTGAARLAAMGALRVGAGLVSVACTPESLPVYAMSLTAVMTKPVSNIGQLDALFDDKRITSILIGPGAGVTEALRSQVLRMLTHKRPCVIDADALTIFQGSPKTLFSAVGGAAVLTPHEGEFERLFSFKGTKPQRAQEAARQSNAVVVYKGNDTVIAAPDGRTAINANAHAWLATAGSGDVLAGLITGLLAQGMPAFEAACAGVWLHGEAAGHVGPGLISEDLPRVIPSALKKLYA